MLGTLLGLVLIALLLFRLRSLWSEHPIPVDEASPPLLAAAVAVAGLAMTVYGAIWPATLRSIGTAPPRGLLIAFYAGQLGKYLPGGAWQYLGRAKLAARLGIPLRAGAASLVVEAGCSLVAAALVGPFALASDNRRLGAAAAAVAALAAAGALLSCSSWVARGASALQRRARLPNHADVQALRGVTIRYALAWLVFGVAFWLLARALYAVPVSSLPFYAGTFTVAWAAGFVVVYAPGGLGIREAVIVLILGSHLGVGEAIVLAASSRIVFTVVDFVGGVVALTVLGRARRAVG